MEFVVQMLLLVVGFLMLIKGADWFVDGAAGIAEKFGIPHLVVGLTIVAMGTSAPEAAVSLTAALKGNAAITIGNVVGSNILNVLIILGLTAAVTAVPVAASTVKIEIPFTILVTVLLGIFGYTGNCISFQEGVFLWIIFVGYLAYLFWMTLKDKDENEIEKEKKPVWKLLLFTLVGVALIIFGSDVTVNAATAIATLFGMSQRFIGLTIVALGTSLPELVTSVSAARKGEADIAIGNIVGSNLFNILFVVGTTALIIPVVFEAAFLIDTVIAAAVVVLLWTCVFRRRVLSRMAGVIMLAGYAVYFVYLIR